MAAYTVSTLSSNAGTATTGAAVSASDTFTNTDGRTFLLVHNRHASTSTTVSITPASASLVVPGVGTVTIPAISAVVAAGTSAIIRLDAASSYGDANGTVTATYTSTASVYAVPFRTS